MLDGIKILKEKLFKKSEKEIKNGKKRRNRHVWC
jgi:hypothetical protein